MIRRGKGQNNKLHQNSMGKTPLGVCVCPQCNYTVEHKRGIPCVTLQCPKCHIPLIRQAQAENNNPQAIPDKNTKTISIPKIDTDLCIGCGACIDRCPSGAIHLEDGKARISVEKCKKCRACVKVCPVGAIR
jgi:ferredoxin